MLTGHSPVESVLAAMTANYEHVTQAEVNHDASTVIITQTLSAGVRHCMDVVTLASGSKVNNLQPARIVLTDESTGLTCTLLYHSDNRRRETDDFCQ